VRSPCQRVPSDVAHGAVGAGPNTVKKLVL
jgi:hypothetical protein